MHLNQNHENNKTLGNLFFVSGFRGHAHYCVADSYPDVTDTPAHKSCAFSFAEQETSLSTQKDEESKPYVVIQRFFEQSKSLN